MTFRVGITWVIAAILVWASVAFAQSETSKPGGQPQNQHDAGNGSGRSAKAVGPNRAESVNPHLAKSPSPDKGLLVEEKQVHTDGRQEPRASKQDPGNHDHAEPQERAWHFWLSLENWPAILTLLANIPTWLIGIRYGRRQARAAEDANALTRQSIAEARRPDGRWSRFDLYAGGAIHDGDNLFRAAFQNYGSQPVTVLETRFPAKAAETDAPFRIVKDLNGVLEPGQGGEVWVEIRLPESVGHAVHDHHAKLSITCEAVVIGGDGVEVTSSTTFDFDRELYAFRLRRTT